MVVPTPQRLLGTWVHYGVVPARGRHTPLYGELRGTAVEAPEAGDATEFFFMHKPPGLRVRFQTDGDRADALDELLRRRPGDWRRDGLLTDWHGGAYEPDEFLFGGPVSMRSVHRAAGWADREPRRGVRARPVRPLRHGRRRRPGGLGCPPRPGRADHGAGVPPLRDGPHGRSRRRPRGGRVRETGSHQHLLTLDGLYADLYELGTRGYTATARG
ncbi:lantibiotic dehydratase C-terminal domain-containing protein [Sphaerisporangium fuscum]|uniref:lantibiotic dehydratase C-terminal domain-containing protein n=1 Tax=Sphaerisporangium fuscum TaxID=2835868 RepID=UPI001BDCFFFD|nr:lantibiotic dehydratase C-terminal domain-containing protein [Sphaerisporangium fuscum]